MIDITRLSGRLGNQMFQHAYLYAQARAGVIPDVYVQSEKYFDNYKDEIKALYGSDIGSLPYIAVHVRRGDYVDNTFYVDLFENGYYERAMELFPDERFLVFSDDIEWCKKQELFSFCALFSEGKNEVDDLNAMASCKGHIIANSSFSWWGAYLSPHGGKVIAPKQWFTDSIERVGLPDSWIKI